VPHRIQARGFERTQCVQGRLCVDTMGDMHESKMPFWNEERGDGAVEVLYRRTQYPSQPLGAVLKLGKAFRKGCERADLQQPIKLDCMLGRSAAVAGIHSDILGNMA
jgi:hypothetical protein